MRGRRHNHTTVAETPESDGWLLTFSDLLFLLLTFFVMKFSMLSFDPLQMLETRGFISNPTTASTKRVSDLTLFENLRSSLTTLMEEVPSGSGKNSQVYFSSGLAISDSAQGVQLAVPLSDLEFESGEFAFRTGNILKLIGRTVAAAGAEITVTPYSPDKTDQSDALMQHLSGTIRQLLDAGVAPRALRGGAFGAKSNFIRVSFAQSRISDKGIEIVIESVVREN